MLYLASFLKLLQHTENLYCFPFFILVVQEKRVPFLAVKRFFYLESASKTISRHCFQSALYNHQQKKIKGYFTTLNTPKATHSRPQSPSFILVNPSGCGDVYKEKLFQFLVIFVIFIRNVLSLFVHNLWLLSKLRHVFSNTFWSFLLLRQQ